ncbi:class I adenylate-forming enzyme family protein [Caulobacter mirabilis]|uniref:3-methylmercaptopropionyl-CoA ligase n=1 Tax=Caulobacter mirabilis TaxID=69666 RepID=A0A2D2B3S7_9CAUL|nr:class I adenylate-forming enzyme family protein [Caulobacter mirabilis]ATQ44854.1 fatty acid--CoA ligase [Caulobacter mirabilis]
MTIEAAHARLTAPGARFEIEEVVIRGIPTKVWKNAPATLRDMVANGRNFPTREFLVYEDDRVTFEAFHRAVAALAAQLAADGVGKGDRVAVIMRNLPEWPVAFFAAISLGAIVTPLNAWWTGPELHYGLVDSGSKVAIVDSERLERIIGHLADCPDLTAVYAARNPEACEHPRVRCLEDVIGAPRTWADLPDRPLPTTPIAPDDDATIFYTSGTTGKPKGALGTHRTMATNVMTSGAALARPFLRRGEAPPAPDPNAPQKVTLLVVPMFHVTGCSATLGPALNNGGKLVLMRKWDALEGMKLIERERVTTTGGVPTIAWQLIEHPERPNFDLSSIEGISYGGAPSAPELVRRIKEVWPTASAGNGWGMTETSATFTSNGSDDYVNRPDSCGPAPAVGEMKIMTVDAPFRDLPPGEVGELWCKGPMVVKGYWNKPEATAQTFVDGWVRTGDLARIDEEGFCFIIDRAKDMLIRGGENIYCIEVENVLYDHPAVMDAALIGIPHKILGEEPAAVVTLKPGAQATEQELRAFVADRLAAFKVPVRVAFWHETLPRNANGKIMKSALKDVFAGDAAA